MKISEIFHLNKSQYELDFVDINPNADIPLFLDPYLISKMGFPLARSAYFTLKSYFEYLLDLLRSGDIQSAKEIFSYLGETNELCLGLSKGTPAGKGMGPTDATRIFASLMKSKAYKTGLMEDIEDFRIFVPNVDKDKVSDMTANIIKKQLIDYTQNQCLLWDIPLQKEITSGHFWNPAISKWDIEYTDMLVYNGRKIILVPKRLISFSKAYSSQVYYDHFILNFLQNEHLKLQSSLVQRRKDNTPYVTKKSIKDKLPGMSKDWLANFTVKHPAIFAKFKDEAIKREKTPQNSDLCGEELSDITDYLIDGLDSIPTGREHASDYHKLIVGILELLFYPQLCNPIIEREIHDGRKRIDLTFDNCAESGFFFRLPQTHSIPSSIIMIECKNYRDDIKNPELDQMGGRFGVNRGMFGITTCRDIQNMALFLKRCQDTYRDGRGLIIPLVDNDLKEMLIDFPEKGEQAWEKLIQERFFAVKAC